jgi:hypothetical protein
VQARLVQRTKDIGGEHQTTLARFGGERLLYRLAKSKHADRFILKGASLLLLWLGGGIRPTKDLDLLGFGDTSEQALGQVFESLCAIDAAEDGLTFLADSVRVQPIREGQEYGGMRVTLMAMLGNTRIPMQVDVGSGDAVVPPPEVLDYPGLLDLPRARLRAYRRETTVAEKTEAMVRLALANSRMKDFFDIYGLSEGHYFDGTTPAAALSATFQRRATEVPREPPLGLTLEFGENPQKAAQWRAFVTRTKRPELRDLAVVVEAIARFLWPALQAAGGGEPWRFEWPAGGQWTQRSDHAAP